MIPVLETERLRLRAHRVEDFEALAAIWGDGAVARYIGGRPSTREESWSRLQRYPGHWALMGFGYWAVEEKASGRLLGDVGFSDLKRAMDPPLDRPEQGWVLAPWGHGKGYASEAVAAALEWAEAHFGHGNFCCIIAPENAASIRVAEKAGYREARRTTYKDEPAIVLHRDG